MAVFGTAVLVGEAAGGDEGGDHEPAARRSRRALSRVVSRLIGDAPRNRDGHGPGGLRVRDRYRIGLRRG